MESMGSWGHAAVLTSDGEVFTFGYGEYGRLGHGGEDNELVPRRVAALAGKHVTQVSAGSAHTAVLIGTGVLRPC